MPDAITSSTNTSTSATSSSRTSLVNNYQMFLTLLTEQLQNQDPLNPLDSNEFVNQLVQFTSVEQQIAQNENLERLISIQSASGASSAVALIGTQALVEDPRADLIGGEASWRYGLADQAAEVDLTITNSDGDVVRRLTGETAAGGHDLVWDGLNEAGEVQPAGVYSLSVTAVDAEDKTVAVDIAGWALVTGADFTNEDAALLFGNRATALADVLLVQERPNRP